MEIDVYSRVSGFNYKATAIFDGFNSLIINKNYYKADDFTLTVSLTAENIELIQPDTLLFMQGRFFYVQDVKVEKIDDETIEITGLSLAGKYVDRIIAQVYTATAYPEQIMFDHFNQEMISPSDTNRAYGYLSIKPLTTFSTNKIQYQDSYDTVSTAVENLATTYDFGFRETGKVDSNGVHNVIEIFKGRDLSKTIQISQEFENITGEGYENSTSGYSNIGYVFGEGDGSNRKNVVVNEGANGIDRRESYIDARDLQQTSQDANGNDVTMTDAQYLQALNARGNDKLADTPAILTLSGELNTESKLFTLGVDFDLGDTIALTSDLFGMSKSVTITSLKYTWDDNGFHVDPVFGKESPVVRNLLKKKVGL